MNARQVHALDRLMVMAEPPLRFADDEETVLHATLEVAHGVDDGNTYEARLWTVASGYYCPRTVYLRSDGVVYVYDSDKDESHEVELIFWKQNEKFGWTLSATVKEEVLAA